MIRLKSIERLMPDKRRTTHCQLDGCGSWTRQGKPFCTTHVDQHAYVQELLAELHRREAEQARVKRIGARAVDVLGTAAQEILQHVRVNGSRTLRRLSREFNRELSVITHYVEALRRCGLVQLSRTKRGGVVVSHREPGHVPNHEAA